MDESAVLINDPEAVRPLVWINEIPWHEINVADELTLRTVHPWARASWRRASGAPSTSGGTCPGT
jgi:hypothetical protein